MLLSEARPRPYRTNYEERHGKFALPVNPGYNDARDEEYKDLLASDSKYRRYTDKKSKEIEWQKHIATNTAVEYNWKHNLLHNNGNKIDIYTYTDYDSAGFDNRFVYFYFYDILSIKANEDSFNALVKSKLFDYYSTTLDVTDNLFPELKEIGNKVDITLYYDEKSQSIKIKYEVRFGRMSDIDANLNAANRAAQLDKLVHRTLDRVSFSEIINRIIKFITNMLRAVKSGGEIQNAVE